MESHELIIQAKKEKLRQLQAQKQLMAVSLKINRDYIDNKT